MPHPRMVINRAVLAVVGLVFLAGGVWLAVTHASWAPRLPGWWPTTGPHTALIDAKELAAVRTQGWWTPTITAGSIAATVLLALWCARQLRSGFRPLMALPTPGTALRTRALEDAMTRQAVAIDGVARCRTRVLTRPGHLRVRLHVWLQPTVAPADVLPAVTALTDHTETALAPSDVRTLVRFSTRSHPRPHLR
ncbi:Asp23/Gls24 family envelope stress response protein [Streptomyces liliifuscus]|uniref:Alkaline shock response membrane anchor protein AmaP n=1 Tax=Streptomyces liliifuscus TaxID=2797636 RepID=A0A7T7RG92_9ACTN|nr:hypothetical protein [Streptomyces liliifuscus]QQM45507.1 hypothetical protein JEQ17_42925 [Streptomyces liliifuscus]